MIRQTAATAYFQKAPMSPNMRPRRAEMRPRTVNVTAKPRTKNREKTSERFTVVVSRLPATTLIRSGIMARTQGLSAVVTPPKKTATTASQGLFWRSSGDVAEKAVHSRRFLSGRLAFFRNLTKSGLANSPVCRKISFPFLSMKTWVGMSWMP